VQVINLLTTGGTMEKAYSERSGAVKNVGSKVEQYLKKLRLPDCDVRVTAVMNKDSLEMTDADRARIAEEVKKKLAEGFPVVITHGTDTLVTTGMHLKAALGGLKSAVVMTGAMTPLGFEGSDGLQNLAEALMAAKLLQPGIYVVMHGQVFPVERARKDKERGTFVSC